MRSRRHRDTNHRAIGTATKAAHEDEGEGEEGKGEGEGDRDLNARGAARLDGHCTGPHG